VLGAFKFPLLTHRRRPLSAFAPASDVLALACLFPEDGKIWLSVLHSSPLVRVPPLWSPPLWMTGDQFGRSPVKYSITCGCEYLALCNTHYILAVFVNAGVLA